jgi:hypothetical protein
VPPIRLTQLKIVIQPMSHAAYIYVMTPESPAVFRQYVKSLTLKYGPAFPRQAYRNSAQTPQRTIFHAIHDHAALPGRYQPPSRAGGVIGISASPARAAPRSILLDVVDHHRAARVTM